MSERNYGLVLEGGAMRGLFTAGVLDVLMENGVSFDGLVGVSAGAAFGSNFKSGQIGRTLRYNLAFCRDKRYCSFRSYLKTGDLFGADFCYRTLPLELDVFDDAAFCASPMEFYAVATDVDNGEAVYFDCREGGLKALDYIRASASMPLVSRPVEIDGKRFLDGGISDSVPLAFFEGLGYRKNVVVLTKPYGYRKKKMPCGAAFALRKLPAVAKAMQKRHLGYNLALSEIEEKEKRGEIFVIRPDAPLPIGHTTHSQKKLRRVYAIGRAVAERELSRLLAYLKEDGESS